MSEVCCAVIPVLAVLAVISPACATDIVVVSPASAVVFEVPKANSAVSPSNEVPAAVPNPGKDVLPVLVTIADA